MIDAAALNNLVNDSWRRCVEADVRQLDLSGLERAVLVLAQNAAAGHDPDGLALPCGTASRRRAERAWHMESNQLEAALRHNVLRAPPETYPDPCQAAVQRAAYLLHRLAGRVALVLAAGEVAGAAAAAALACPGSQRGTTPSPWAVCYCSACHTLPAQGSPTTRAVSVSAAQGQLKRHYRAPAAAPSLIAARVALPDTRWTSAGGRRAGGSRRLLFTSLPSPPPP